MPWPLHAILTTTHKYSSFVLARDRRIVAQISIWGTLLIPSKDSGMTRERPQGARATTRTHARNTRTQHTQQNTQQHTQQHTLLNQKQNFWFKDKNKTQTINYSVCRWLSSLCRRETGAGVAPETSLEDWWDWGRWCQCSNQLVTRQPSLTLTLKGDIFIPPGEYD